MQIESLRNQNQWAVTQPAVNPTEVKAHPPEIIAAVKAVNEAGLYGQDYELAFGVDRTARRPLLRLVDRNTREVVRQIPPESVLEQARELEQFG